ncbi:MAG: alkylated repair dioxygenase [Caulobacteraceae bacterium]|nr:alkylated repair dioxygenase [Caulobacteraceae bacterium]
MFDGFTLHAGALNPMAQKALVDAVLALEQAAPFYQPLTRSGPMSVMMTNFGQLGWFSDPRGYRYQPRHPLTERPWPAIPAALLELWDQLAGAPGPPDACLVNLYRADARMGLHQDRNERDLSYPVLSVSLGDTALFRIGPPAGGRTGTFRLSSGDVSIMGGAARLARHGIDRILPGSSRLIPGGGRINLTLRKAG